MTFIIRFRLHFDGQFFVMWLACIVIGLKEVFILSLVLPCTRQWGWSGKWFLPTFYVMGSDCFWKKIYIARVQPTLRFVYSLWILQCKWSASRDVSTGSIHTSTSESQAALAGAHKDGGTWLERGIAEKLNGTVSRMVT